MKTLLLVGGTMGVGKTAACQILKRKLDRCVFLDGDWCWDMHPFQVTEETKRMVEKNITFLLNQFLRCEAYDTVIFCWVMHEQAILDSLLSKIHTNGARVVAVSLVCGEDALRARLTADVERGARSADVIERSVARIPLYRALNTRKLDVTDINAEQAADALISWIGPESGSGEPAAL